MRSQLARLTQPGSRNDTVIQSSDFYPTFVELLGLKPQPGQVFDGSACPALAGKPLDRQASSRTSAQHQGSRHLPRQLR